MRSRTAVFLFPPAAVVRPRACGMNWLFDSGDFIAVVHTAFPDAQSGPHNQHDADYLTFDR